MNKYILYISLSLFLSLLNIHTSAETIFTQNKIQNDTWIDLYDNSNHIGFVSYRKIPLTSFYVVHSLYVNPNYRNQGYGKRLVMYVYNLIRCNGGTRIYIQPGPFEMENDKGVKVTKDYQERMRNLIAFYKKMGFQWTHKVTSSFASFIYKIMGIDENAKYLMVKML